MTSKLTREEMQELISALRLTPTSTVNGISLGRVANALSESMATMDSEPVVPIWGATKYPVSRPMPGTKLIVWDDTGKFVGYGSAVDTSESGVAIQMCDGRRLDSNHELRWQYALQPVPVVDNEPVMFCMEGNDLDPEAVSTCREVVDAWVSEWNTESRSPGEPIYCTVPLYRHAQPAPVVPNKSDVEAEFVDDGRRYVYYRD